MAKKVSAQPARRRRKKVVPTKVRWNSDVIVDLMRQFDFPYVPLNPGSSFRGLHDSMVNYGQDDPQMLRALRLIRILAERAEGILSGQQVMPL